MSIKVYTTIINDELIEVIDNQGDMYIIAVDEISDYQYEQETAQIIHNLCINNQMD